MKEDNVIKKTVQVYHLIYRYIYDNGKGDWINSYIKIYTLDVEQLKIETKDSLISLSNIYSCRDLVVAVGEYDTGQIEIDFKYLGDETLLYHKVDVDNPAHTGYEVEFENGRRLVEGDEDTTGLYYYLVDNILRGCREYR